ncbi:capsular polysaccharide biosynthesis protein [Thalassotalea sp. HSM 43]|uniref:capsular polysaccharide biosynthesis protein n=1 Tax=Thalassotalea sp. HSM 43 TaxID=2552945 RepID=UPI001080437A|nr:capsular polysaccharide biosynthesis protein [Thalassotalea sp. HSM 43]QBY03536.1 capsular polysaccharide biosynthesis protein [Thalassotalea sp. HSM 43]
MTLWTTSKGIYQRQALIEACLKDNLSLVKSFVSPADNDKVLGWGLKKNTLKAKAFAQKHHLDYLYLEDGFIGYIGHPAKNGQNVSLITDSKGLYYQANSASTLEELIVREKTEEQLSRSENLIRSISEKGVTKYNCYASSVLPRELKQRLSSCENETVLVVDQVAGDLSIKGSLANKQSFIDMLASARQNHPNATIFIRVHPDTKLGKKKGVLASLNLDNVEIIDDVCHPHALIKSVDFVYTVSSQMGFEALILNKPVYCFGMPFYAGWGLTNDSLSSGRKNGISLQALVHASLVEYPKYFNPITNEPCEIEDIIDIVQQQYLQPRWQTLYAVNFSIWKRSFIQSFSQKFAREVKFVKSVPNNLKESEQLLIWGAKNSDKKCLRVEDGFIRSSGLGSNLCRPSSLAFDNHGMYFDSSIESDLERLIKSTELSAEQFLRAQKLLTNLKNSQVSKYNVGKLSEYIRPDVNKPILLVVGQVDGDASLEKGSPFIQTNEELLWAVRNYHPGAYIIYKPHPDVVAGNRAGVISADCKNLCVDEEVTELTLTSLYSHIDQLHTMTSLSGFEALIKDVNVVTWGQPFYSGWGLTKDMHPLARRKNLKTIEELLYATLIQYPTYIDWDTGLFASAENIVSKVQQQTSNQKISISPMQKLFIKLSFLWQAMTMRISF